MAKQPPFNQSNLDSSQKQADVLQTRLSDSPTAYSSSGAPSASDLSMDQKLQAINSTIDKLKSQKLTEQWYGPNKSTEDVAPPPSGFISKGLNALTAPLYAVSGAVESALGKGTKPGFWENVNANVNQEHKGFGNLLQEYNVPKFASMPLGFALDVMMDPVNWITAGAGALIPRIGTGLIKGTMEGGLREGVERAGVGALSNLQGKARAVMPWTAPVKSAAWMGEKLGEESALGRTFSSGAEKYGNLISSMGEKAIAGSEKYDTMMGTDVYSKLGKGIFGLSDLNQDKTLGSSIESNIRKIPEIGFGKMKVSGDDIVDFFKYSPSETNKINRQADKVQELSNKMGLISVKENGEDVFKSIDEVFKPGTKFTVKDGLINQAQVIYNDGVKIGDAPIKVADNFENAQRILDMAGEDYNLKHLTKAYEETPVGKTGVKWYDDFMDKQKERTVGGLLETVKMDNIAKNLGIFDKVKDWTPLNSIINANDQFMKIFKWAKVPANIASHVYAFVGNTTFAKMMGMPVEDSRYVKNVYNNYQFLRGKRGAQFVKESFFNDANTWFHLMETNPRVFKNAFGFGAETILGRIPMAGEKLPVKEAMKLFNPTMTLDDIHTAMMSNFENIQKNLDAAVQAEMKLNKTAEEIKTAQANIRERKPYPSSTQTLKDVAEKGGGKVRTSDMPSGWMANEAGAGSSKSYLDKAKTWAEENKSKSPAHWIANNILNSMPNHYEYIDQSFKLSNAQYLTNIGIPEKNLLILSRMVPISKSDLLEPIIENGKKLYRLTPQKAAEASAETFMNYAAMPDSIKVLRALPIVGGPFFSFQMAMLGKTGKTLIHNPAVFNKISFLMNEISGARTPTERQALQDKYNVFLQSQTVVRLSKNWNVDLKNLIPYFTMNMLNPSQRKYNDTLPGVIANTIDNSPFMKHPIGQTILDYMILPSILSGADQPQGQFGQPIYPMDANFGQKAFYAGRSLAESVVPGVASYAGLTQIPLKAAGVPDEAINYYPSYGMRQTAEATQGKNTIGAQTKEDPFQKTIRALLARSGLPLYPLNTDLLSNQSKKKIKK